MLHQSNDTNPSCKRLLFNPQQFTLDNPPPIPRLGGLPEAISQVVPVIVLAAGNVMNYCAVKEPNLVHIFAFNRLMSRNMRNGDWETYASACVYHSWINFYGGEYNDDEKAIEDACYAVFTAYAAVLAMSQPYIGDALNSAARDSVRREVQKWEDEYKPAYDEIEQLHLQASQGQMDVGNSVSVSSLGFRRPGAGPNTQQQNLTSRTVRNRVPGGEYVPPERNAYVHNRADPYNPFAGRGNARQQNDRPRRSVTHVDVGALMANNKPAAASAAPAPDTTFASTMTEMIDGKYQRYTLTRTTEGGSTLTLNDWRPTATQRFHPVGYIGEDISYERARAHTGSDQIIAISTERDPMDPSEHVISAVESMYRRIAKREANETTVQPDIALGEIGKAIASGGVGENEEATRVYRHLGASVEQLKEEAEACSSVAELIQRTRMQRLSYVNTSAPDTRAFIAHGTIARSFVTKKDISPIFEELQKSKTLTEVAERLNSFASENVGLDDAAFVAQLNRYLRTFVMHFVQLNMGQRAFKFDDFMEDMKDIPGAIANDYGKLYRTYFENNEKAFIEMLFSKAAVDTDEWTETVELGDTKEERTIGFVSKINRYVTCLMIDLTREGFGLKTPAGVPCQIFEGSFGGLHGLCTELFKARNANVLETHYIVLADDTVYELACSRLSENPSAAPMYIIREIEV